MRNVIIIHGTAGSPEGNWFPWLKEELQKLNCNVIVPKFPTPEGQNLENWTKIFKDYEKYLHEDSIIVGHSLSPAFLLSVLEKLDHPIKAAFFVSGWLGLLNDPYFDPLIESFVTKEFNWEKIKNNCKTFYTFHGDNDPYVPLEKGRDFAEKLGSELNIIKNGGHLNEEFGFTRFETLLKKIKLEL